MTIRRACDDESSVGFLSVGAAFTLNEVDWTRGERIPEWRQPVGFAPVDGRRPVSALRLVVVTGYRRRMR